MNALQELAEHYQRGGTEPVIRIANHLYDETLVKNAIEHIDTIIVNKGTWHEPPTPLEHLAIQILLKEANIKL